MKYRKKALTIEALQWMGGNRDEIKKFCGNACDFDDLSYDIIEITTLTGIATARPGDWVIKGIMGEFYPCKQDIFEATYEKAESADATPTGAQETARA